MMQNSPIVDEKKLQMSRSELIWGVVLYGVIMWAAGFVWAMAVL